VFAGEAGLYKLQMIIEEIKLAGRKQKYDCILGVSGGVDSTYLALKAKELGLNVLCVHFDNGWNSELSVKNIENIVTKLNFDLETYVINWDEFKDLQLAYFKANVVDIEAVTYHAIIGTIYRMAAKNNIKYILSGNNVVTESIMPQNWVFNKLDHVNITDIHKKNGTLPLKSYPIFNNNKKNYYHYFKGIRIVDLLNTMPYLKKDIKQIIIRELDWKDYGGKHYESVFTRFYQGYILPEKFGIDKRKPHLSNLICSGQITREQALEELSKPIYNENTKIADKEFVLKKLGFSEKEFEDYINTPRREHTDYKIEKTFYKKYPFLIPVGYLKNKTRKMLRTISS